MAGDFYAKNSWDYLLIRPLIIKYLERHRDGDRYPHVISDTQLYDDISSQGVARFGSNRLFHCISRVLRELGYARRSRRGRTWDIVGDLNFQGRISPSALTSKVPISNKLLSGTKRRRISMRSPPNQFYPSLTEDRVEKTYQKGRDKGLISPSEEAILREYIAEYRATRHIKIHRVIKSLSDLIQWKRFLKVPYHEAKIKDIHSGITAMMAGDSLLGKPFRQNTKHDYVKALRAFLLWMIESGRSTLDEKKVRKIKVPPRDFQTTTSNEILTPDEVTRIINAGGYSRDRALVAVLYETGSRIQEMHRLQWKDLEFDLDGSGIGVSILDTKTKRVRHGRVIAYREHIATWRKESPGGNNPEAYVFTDIYRHEPLEYRAMVKVIQTLAKKAGISKRVHTHLFRKTRATHMVLQGYRESIIKEMVWGNQDTRVLKTYCVLSAQDIDRELNAKAGISKPIEPVETPIRPRVCPNCNHMNTPSSEWCGKCMAPLTDESRDRREQLIQDIIAHPEVIAEAYRRDRVKTQ